MINKLRKKISIVNRTLKTKKHSYSFGGCDLLINYLFKNKKKGFYLDIGCQHPTFNNNTYLLFKRGWSGVNIDLDRKNIDLFDIARPKDINICSCVSSDLGEKDFFYFHEGSPINTLERKTLLNKDNYLKKKIKTNTLNNILDQLNKIEEIDYMNIDVEGHEMSILNSFDIDKYKPSVISVEFIDFKMKKLELKYNNIERVIDSNLYKFLTNQNYNFINWSHSDLIFAHDNFAIQNRDTPLVIAAQNGHLEVVRVLLDRGADVNLADKVCSRKQSFL